jgi:hypothetical protein
MGITRDASGLFAAADLDTAAGGGLSLRNIGRRGGFWVPMGSERRGPTMSAYDELVAVVDHSGEHGFGLVEQGTVRKIF